MKFSTDPTLLSDKEIKSLWRNNSGTTDGVVQFFEQVFDCDRLTAQSVAQCIVGGSQMIHNIEGSLESLTEDVRAVVNNAIIELKRMG